MILVPIGLPIFLPVAFAERLGLGFWPAMTIGFVLASISFTKGSFAGSVTEIDQEK